MTFRNLASLVLAISAISFAGPTGAVAQQDLMAGGGLVLTDMDPFGLGLQVNASAAIAEVENLRVAGDLTYYLPDSESETIGGETYEASFGMIALNANAHYFFFANETLSAYGLGGLNISRSSTSVDFAGATESDSNMEFGLNLGAGLHYPVTFGVVYGEVKLVTGDYDRMELGGGVRIPLGN